ncbi:MAG: AzlC family ABC transporter permease [Saccharofermentans sp.]|nr:AzlC family ABC transporter permease [Saccharofermentans sp.]
MSFKNGFKSGLIIGSGYLSVSFSFGIMAVNSGLTWWQAVLISITCLTSAGQVAGVGIMAAGGGIIEMAVAQLVINLRYSLMAISLSQKTDKTMTLPARLIDSYVITDEIFGVASTQESVGFRYMTGLGILPIAGWTLGTFLGAVLGNILPAVVTSCLAIGIYGMFVAIVLPVCRQSKTISIICIIAVLLAVVFRYLPFLYAHVSSGFAIIICAVIAAFVGVLITPEDETQKEAADGQ